MSLFGTNEHKAAEQAAAKAEVGRLTALPVADLAAELIGAFPDQASSSGGLNELQVATWALRDVKAKTGDTIALRAPIKEALQALENAGLAERTALRGGGWLNLTRAGRDALADDSVRAKLG